MRIVHSLARYYPDQAKVGGIQMHVAQLCRQMRVHGVHSSVLASSDEFTGASYIYDNTLIYRYPTAPEPPREPNHGPLPHVGFRDFESNLRLSVPDIYHQHQWTPKCGLQHLRAAVRLGVPAIVSFHVPIPLCPREDGMYSGREQCEDFLRVERCTSCVQRSRYSAQNYPSIETLVNYRVEALNEIAKLASRVVVAADWLKRALLQQGFPENKLVLSPYAVQRAPLSIRAKPSPPFKFVFFGRWTPDKGPHVAIEAFKRIASGLPAELHLYGTAQDEAYERNIREAILDEPKIFSHESIPLNAMLVVMRQSAAVLVPSQWLETGPLVVLHARDVGVPVIGSRLGGVAEEIKNGYDGILVEHDSINEWAAAMLRTIDEKIYSAMTPRPPRAAEDEAREFVALYRRLLGH